ncbi:MAG: SDR family NAD(P)-dependent oxidoreductase [Candidatus Heimdallarchaeota archaeon]|nr:SDR family NAD(P)-dependent oxidoreductase [Candidatus Heimdallarchaeota archaeon]
MTIKIQLSQSYEKEPIAIVGVGSLFPDAKNTEEFWNNIINKHDSIREVPKDRWDPELYYSEDRDEPDKSYTTLGAFIDHIDFNPIHFRIPPKVMAQIDMVQQMALIAAKEALEDANYSSETFPNENCAVILGNSMGGENKTYMDMRVLFPYAAAALKRSEEFKKLSSEHQSKLLEELEKEYKKDLADINEDSMPGELSNVISGRIAATFNLRGKSMTSDAACASSLAAMDEAYKGLLSHEFDAVVVGGADRSLHPPSYVKFSKIGALSANGSYPFDIRADGFVQGEGAGMLVMKRLSDAKKAGDKIYALLIGVGASSDGKGKGITAPNPIGQELAIKRAFETAEIDPSGIQMVEAHGTSTKVGDKIEVNTMNKVLGEYNLPRGSIKLGSIKSQIGHLKSAAGIASLIKMTLALHHKTMPPSINFETPNPTIEWEAGPLEVITEPTNWIPTDTPRRCSVSSFGFGGTNYVCILEEYNPSTTYLKPKTSAPKLLNYSKYVQRNEELVNEAIIASAKSLDELTSSLKSLDLKSHLLVDKSQAHIVDSLNALPYNNDDKYRVGITYKTAEDMDGLISLMQSSFEDDTKRSMAEARGVFVSNNLKGKISFVFPGQGSQYTDMMLDLAMKYQIVQDTFDEADEILSDFLDKPLSNYIFSNGRDKKEVEEGLRQTEITQPAMLTADVALYRLLLAYGLKPDMVAGHSLGEYAALVAAGILDFADALMAVAIRGKAMSTVDADDKGTMAAISGKYEDIDKILQEVEGYCIAANKNSLSSTVISGSTEGVNEAITLFESRGMKATRLSVSAAFHTTIVEPAGIPLAEFLDTITFKKPRIPITSNVTGKFFPEDPEEIRELMKQQVRSSVEWTEQVKSMFAAGSTIYYEVGPKRALSSFVSDILKDETILSIVCNHPKKGGIKSFNEVLASMAALGMPVPRFDADDDIYHHDFQWEHLKGIQQEQVSVESKELDQSPTDFGSFIDKTLEYLDGQAGKVNRLGLNLDKVVVTGVGVGLPGRHKEVFDERNFDLILKGENMIDNLPKEQLDAQLDKKIKRLIKKPSGDAEFFSPKNYKDVINLAGQAGKFDLVKEFDIDAKIADTYDQATGLAIAAGLLALRDAGIPLVRSYKKTSTGSFLPGDWELPADLQEDTGVVFASAFPGYNKFASEIKRFNKQKFKDRMARILDILYAEIDRKVGSELEKKSLMKILEQELRSLDQDGDEYEFNRKILLEALSMGHAQFAQLIKAKGPNTQVNAACASTTQAVGLANDWIRTGRCKRVLVISADNITSDELFEWLGSGFLASGAAAIKDKVEEAALPFDKRRDGMIIGMGAAALVVESQEESNRRGVAPIVEILGTYYSNSAFHGTRLNVNHVSSELGKFMDKMKKLHQIDPEQIARSMMFMSHETYTPRRGGSAAAEIKSLRDNFGSGANAIHIANTKGITGHAMGAGIEDVVAIKAIEKGLLPPIANFKVPDPDLGDLKLSKGGKVSINYGLRLAAGFGSQVAFALYKKVASGDRFGSSYDAWLEGIGGTRSELYLQGKSLRLKDKGVDGYKPSSKPARKIISKPTSTSAFSLSSELSSIKSSPPTKSPFKEDSAPGIGKQELTTALIDEIVASTGYPRETVSPDLELEADLGIDSVKVAEIFGNIRSKYGLQEDGELNIAEYPTIDAMAEYFAGRTGDAPFEQENTVSTSTSGGLGKQELTEALIDEIVVSTGYPKETVYPDLELEADLGIDSVKVAEIFGNIRTKYGMQEDGELNIAEYPTIDAMAEYFAGRMGSSGNNQPVKEPESNPEVKVKSKPKSSTTGKKNSHQAILDTLVNEIAESTGYPKDMIDPELEIEADLGIDSVKVAEVFGSIREHYGLEQDDDLNIADLPRIVDIAEYFSNRVGSEPEIDTFDEIEQSSGVTIPKEEFTKALIEEIARATGYPENMIDSTLDIEADLGVDSVKVAEVATTIRERYGLAQDDEFDLSTMRTIDALAEYYSNRSAHSPPAKKDQVKSQIQAKKLTPSSDPEERLKQILSDVSGYPISMIDDYVSMKDDLGMSSGQIDEAFRIIEADFDVSAIQASTFAELKNLVVDLSKAESIVSTSSDVKDQLYELLSELSGMPTTMMSEYVTLDDLGLDIQTLQQKLEGSFGIPGERFSNAIIINDILLLLTDKPVAKETKTKTLTKSVEKPKPSEPAEIQSYADVERTLINIISEQTGYDQKSLDDTSLSLEADLGIDSVKSSEIFGMVRERFHVAYREDLDLGQYDTIEKIAEYMHKHQNSAVDEERTQKKAVLADSAPTTHRYVLRTNHVETFKKYRGPGIIIGGTTEITKRLSTLLGFNLRANIPDSVDSGTTLIFFHPTEGELGGIDTVFELLKPFVEKSLQLVLMINTELDAQLSAYQGALGGLFKALSQEFEGINAKIVKIDRIEVVETELANPAVEVEYKDGKRYEIALAEQDLEQVDWKLPKQSVLLVSGGAQGITFECIKPLVQADTTLILLGRTKIRDDAEDVARMTESEIEQRKLSLMEELKEGGERVTPVVLNKEFSKIEKSATVWKNIQTLKELGAEVIYEAIDISDEDNVMEGFTRIKKVISAPITHFIHAAGLEISKPTLNKSVEEFQMVYNIKTKGLEYLLDQMDLSQLKRVVSFSSVAGRFGNATQADYSAANEYLAKRMLELRSEGINAMVIDWSAWADVGMATRGSTMKVLESQGVTPIPLQQGVRRFVSEFALSEEPEVVISGELGALAAKSSWYKPDFGRGIMIDDVDYQKGIANRTLSLRRDLYLDDHRIDGKAVLPGVMGMETMVQTTQAIKNEEVCSIVNIEFASPVKLPRDKDLDIVVQFKDRHSYASLELKSIFVGPDGKQLGDLREHFTADLVYGTRIPGFKALEKKYNSVLMDKKEIYEIFFHGPRYQVLHALNKITDTSAVATFVRPGEPMFLQEEEMEIDPLAIEAAFQAAGLHLLLTEGIMGLPSEIGAIHLFKGDEPRKIKVHYLRSTPTHSVYDVLVLDKSGTCVIHLHEYAMINTGKVDVPEIALNADGVISKARYLAGKLASSIVSVDVDPLQDVLEEFVTTFLTVNEQARYSGIKVGKKRKEWLAGRIAAKIALSRELRVPPQTIDILKDENKAPFCIYHDTEVAVSISHSNGIAMAVVNAAVDVEKVEPRDETFTKQMFSDDERERLDFSSDEQVTRYWSTKEAHLKRMRIGLKTEISGVIIESTDGNSAKVVSPQGSSTVTCMCSGGWVVTIAKN